MDEFGLLLQGFQSALTPTNLLFCFVGVTVGQFIGVLPGIGPVAGTAVLIPLTFGLNPTSAIIMLAGLVAQKHNAAARIDIGRAGRYPGSITPLAEASGGRR